MVGAAFTIGWIAMAGQHDLDAHFGGALHYPVEVIHLEPKQHSITIGSVGAIADGAVMMFDFKAMQLQDEPAILHQLLILLAAVSPVAAQQALIPSAAGLDICDTDERLGAHGSYGNRTPALKLGNSILALSVFIILRRDFCCSGQLSGGKAKPIK